MDLPIKITYTRTIRNEMFSPSFITCHISSHCASAPLNSKPFLPPKATLFWFACSRYCTSTLNKFLGHHLPTALCRLDVASNAMDNNNPIYSSNTDINFNSSVSLDLPHISLTITEYTLHSPEDTKTQTQCFNKRGSNTKHADPALPLNG